MLKIFKICFECLYVFVMNYFELYVWYFVLFKMGILNCVFFMKNKVILFILLLELSD